jgi:hypothetical protein
MHNPKTPWVKVKLVFPRVFKLDIEQREKLRNHTDDLLLSRIPSRTHAHAAAKRANAFTPLLDNGVFACPPFSVNLVRSREQIAVVEQWA